MTVLIRSLTGLVLSASMLAAGFAAAPAWPEPAGPAGIAVLVSHDAPPYRAALQGFEQEMRARRGDVDEIRAAVLDGDAQKAEASAAGIRKDDVKMILALGSLAMEAALRRTSGIPVVAGLVVDADEIAKRDSATGVILGFPLKTQFQELKRFCGECKTVGVIYNSQQNGKIIEEAQREAVGLGLRLDAQEVLCPQDIPAALQRLSRTADILWAIPDRLVLTPQTAQHLLLFSYRNRIPFVGLSASWVKAGALYALDWDYEDLGRQCAELAHAILRGVPPGDIPPSWPRRIGYAVNLKTARHMKIPVPAELAAGDVQTFE